jgi:low temperature requirement protein LtrA
MPEIDERRVTPLELFFDLVYVFAFTQVTHLMAHHQSAETVLQGLSILGILWWSWASHAWLANHHAADRTVVRAGIVVAIVIVFLLSVAVPEAYSDGPGGLSAPMLFAIGFVTLSLTYTAVNLVLAVGDPAFRRQVIRTMGVTIAPVSAALLLGALAGGREQLVLWLAAVVIEGATVFVTSHGGEWRVSSTAHYAERHGLVVLLALGESIISVGRGSAELPISTMSVAGCLVAVSLSLGLWAVYFSRYAPAIEGDVARRRDTDRATIATLGTYVHLGIVAGILLVSLGLGQAMTALGERGLLPMVAAGPLGVGLAMVVLSTAAHWWAAVGHVAVARIVTGLLALGAIPLLASLDVLTAMASVAALTLGLVCVERYAKPRRRWSPNRPTPAAGQPG